MCFHTSNQTRVDPLVWTIGPDNFHNTSLFQTEKSEGLDQSGHLIAMFNFVRLSLLRRKEETHVN